MTYLINEIFYTLQGEGVNTGKPAVFIRFARCNLWTGREADREAAICRFCDTDFLHGKRMALEDILSRVTNLTRGIRPRPMIVLTGGEPLLQVDAALINALRRDYYVAVETNGTQGLPAPVDWVCVSPKAATSLVLRCGDELKLVYPQTGGEPERYEDLTFRVFWLSPMDGPDIAQNTKAAVEYCLEHPRWRLNIQTHKVIGVR
jgi:7-carboxy-7-deazaguanine synthase